MVNKSYTLEIRGSPGWLEAQALLARAKEEEARVKLEEQRAMRRRVTDAVAVVQTDDRLSYCRQLLREASSACVLDAITGNLVHVQVRTVRIIKITLRPGTYLKIILHFTWVTCRYVLFNPGHSNLEGSARRPLMRRVF